MGFKNMKKDILINVLTINKIYVRPAHKDRDWDYYHEVYDKKVGFLWWRHSKHIDREYWMTPWSFDDHKYSMSEMEEAIESYNFFKGKEVYVKASVKITFSKKDAEYIYFDSDQDMRDWVDSFISKYGKNYISI